MRIQHNIMAMNAYRNYNLNNKALSGNLEKLSSGYKINRAGDDAAGLAISEKMRAQITGLNAAQKNVKDGVSLVKTAEGAMQEIQDMLNRMDYLATQSANGTYDNDTDRANLQKEVEQLKTEINRIADSANFNGIKLLNGSLDANATGLGATEANAGTVSSIVTSTVGGTLGTNTILHSSGVEADETVFSVDLHELTFSNKSGETLTMTIGGNTFTLDADDTGSAGTEMDAAAIADAFRADKFKDADGNVIDHTALELTDGTNTGTFTVTGTGNRLTFTQASGEDPVNGDMTVSVTGDGTDAVVPGTVTGTITTATVTADTAPADGVKAKYSYDFTGITGLTAGSYTVGIGGQNVTVTLTEDAHALSDLLAAVKDEVDGKIADGMDDSFYTATVNGNKIEFEAGTAGDAGTQLNTAIAGNISVAAATAADATKGVSGDYNMKTTVTTQGVKEGASRIASGIATVNKDFFADGNIIKVGNEEYTVSTDVADKDEADKIYVGGLDLTTDAGLKAAVDELSRKADSNEVWTIGYDGVAANSSAKIHFVEKVSAAGDSYTDQNSNNGVLNDDAFDLSDETVIKETFGTITGRTEATTGKSGESLVLQIGDTSDAFNQMKVNIGSMKTDAMGKDFTMTTKDGITTYNMGTQGADAIAAGTKPSTQTIADVDISDRDKASDAINTIKNAINYVSGVRGDLGALQNRLEHTGNNLSVMAENIQDAESTIRDTDVAEEMMSYVKNNILVQSAQAMLAQANQVPQGVLQLLG